MTSETGRGARTFKIGEEEVTIFFNLNAQFAAEAELDKSASEIAVGLEYSTFNAASARAVLWAGLNGAGKKITLEEAGEYPIGQRETLHLQAAFSRSQLSAKETEKLADKVDVANEARNHKTAEALDEATEELRRPPIKKRGGKGGKRSRG